MNVVELSDAIGAEHRALDALIRTLGGDQVERTVTGSWSVKDVLGHLAAHAGVTRRAIAAGLGRRGEHPDYFDDRERWNAEVFESNRDRAAGPTVTELQVHGARYLALVKSLHEEDLIKHIRFPWGGEGTVHELIVAGLAHHRGHREQLAAALGQAVETGETTRPT